MLTIRGRLITPFILGSMSVGLNIQIRHSFMDLWVWIMAWVPWPQLLLDLGIWRKCWVPCVGNSSYSFIPNNLKLCRLFFMVFRYACDFGIIQCHFFFTFELSHFWDLNTIKMHYRWYLVCTTPPTVLYQSIWNFAGPYVMVCRCACGFGTITNLTFVPFYWLLNLAIFVLKYYGQCIFKGKHIVGGIVFYKYIF